VRPDPKCSVAGTAVFVVSFVLSLQLSVVTTPTASEAQPQNHVDRTLKGDRLPLIHDTGDARLHGPKLPDGCVNAAESPKSIYTSEVAGRCLV
jgi:hypothetical protein